MSPDNDYSTWSDVAIIEALRAGCADVRNYVYLQYVVTALRFPLNSRRMSSYSITDNDVFVEFWERLYAVDPKTGEDGFASFQPGGNAQYEFQKWVYAQVDNVISSLVWHETRTIVRNDPSAPPIDEISPDIALDHLETAEKKAFVQECFSELWEKNPMRAYVLLMMTQFSCARKEQKESVRDKKYVGKKVTYEDLANFLYITVDNAKQLYHQAKKQFRQIMESKRKDV